MTTTPQQPRGALLVGSVPLESAAAVFRAAGTTLGNHLRWIPDGETGVRSNWIGWQLAVLTNHPQFEAVPPDPATYPALPRTRLRPHVNVNEIAFGALGYAEAAKSSYAVFAQQQQAGVIPAHCRFQVSLPTPLAPVNAFVISEDQAAVESPYETRLLAELREITTAIPHRHLAIQWDVAVEIGLLEGIWPVHFSDVWAGIIERLVRLGHYVPPDVDLGYHLCYGDAGHKHFKQPVDASILVEVANAVSAAVTRPINWLHLPVPRDRTDDAYFAPLRNLKLHPETELYLGLVHFTDGLEGTQRRIAAAQRAIERFSVATECALGRRPPETIPALLQIHAEVAAPIA